MMAWLVFSLCLIFLMGLHADNGLIKQRSQKLTNIFENSQTEFQFDYAEDLDDGRGVTFGIIGFTTRNGDGLQLMEAYNQLQPDNVFAPFMASLQDGGEDLDQTAFIEAVKTAGNDILFQQAQIEQADLIYWNPSQEEAEKIGLKLALSKAQLYDTWVQHGAQDEPCCLGALSIISKTTENAGDATSNEQNWLTEFFKQRRIALTTATGDTANQWKMSLHRVTIYEELCNADAWHMDLPLAIGYQSEKGYYTAEDDHYGQFRIA